MRLIEVPLTWRDRLERLGIKQKEFCKMLEIDEAYFSKARRLKNKPTLEYANMVEEEIKKLEKEMTGGKDGL